MANTGYKIIQYIDDNPNSPTYGQTWTRRVHDEVNCKIDYNDWELVGTSCEMDTSGFTGNRIYTYYSESSNEYSSITESDTSCVESSLEEIWIATGEEWCEEIDGHYTGYKIQIQKQMNINLSNYGEKREYRYFSYDCAESGTTCTFWEEMSRACHIDYLNCSLTYDGTADVIQINRDPSSETYNKTRKINVEDSGCSNCTSTVFEYVEIGDFCGDDVCSSGFSSGATPTTLYTVSQKHKIISGISTPMDEYLVEVVEEESEECGYIRPHYRWVRTDATICVGYDLYGIEKEQVSNDGEITWADYFVDGELVTRMSEQPIAVNVYSCGYPMYRWVDIDEHVCTECENVEYRWTVAVDDYLCAPSSFNKYTKEYLETSCNGGEWEKVMPEVSRMGDLIEEYSEDCEAPPTKALIYGTDNILLQTVVCDETDALSAGDITATTSATKKIVITGCTKTIGSDSIVSGMSLFSIEEIIIGDGVKRLNGRAIDFRTKNTAFDSTSINKIVIGKDVNYMAPMAICIEGSDVDIYFTSPTPPAVDNYYGWCGTLMFLGGWCTIHVPSEYRSAYEAANIKILYKKCVPEDERCVTPTIIYE